MLDARVGKDEQTTAHGAIVHICVMWTCLLTRHGDSRLMQPHKAMRVLQLAICCCFAVPDGKAQLWLGWVSQALSGEGSTAVRQARRSMECFYGPRDGDKGRCSI
jgi:hypothetical protein